MKIPEDLPEDFEELINELNSVDGMGSAILISDNKLFELLEHKGLAKMNTKHAHYGTPLLSYLMKIADGNIETIVNHLK